MKLFYATTTAAIALFAMPRIAQAQNVDPHCSSGVTFSTKCGIFADAEEGGTAVGHSANAGQIGVAVGQDADAGTDDIAIGRKTSAQTDGIAIGGHQFHR